MDRPKQRMKSKDVMNLTVPILFPLPFFAAATTHFKKQPLLQRFRQGMLPLAPVPAAVSGA
jgi:hypothetical protein